MIAWKPFCKQLLNTVGYDVTHITRTVAYNQITERLKSRGIEKLDAMEISGGEYWKSLPFRTYKNFSYPAYDICSDSLDATFDVIIADNIFEHLKYPGRAAKNVHKMLREGGVFVNITPFMIRYHPVPIDCTRWTPDGMRWFLEEAGFVPDRIEAFSWGNRRAVVSNLRRWSRTGFKRNLPNDKRFPVTVWVLAGK